MDRRRIETETPDWRFIAIASLLVGLAALLRFHRLGSAELWMDEAFSFEMAAFADAERALLRENSPPLYYLLQRLWLGLFGPSEAALRSLAAIFGTLGVAALIAAGRWLLTPTAGLWAGAIAAVAPQQIYYAQEARPYSLLVLALVLAVGALWRAVESGARSWWAAWAVFAAVALATHYFAALVLLPAASLLWLRPIDAADARPWRPFLLASGAAIAPIAAWTIWSFGVHTRPLAGHGWIAAVWEATPPLLAIPKSLEIMLLGGQKGLLPGFWKQFTLLEFPFPLRLLGIALGLALGVFALDPSHDQRLGLPRLGRRKLWLLALTLFPLVSLWLGSFVRPYYLVGRYDVVAFPGLALLLALGLAKLGAIPRFGRVAAPVAGALLGAVLCAKLHYYYDAAAKPAAVSARATARALADSLHDGDLTIFSPGRGIPVHYYLRRLGYDRNGSLCTHSESGHHFQCLLLSFDDQSMVPNLDHLDRVAFSMEVMRADVRAQTEAFSEHNSLWLELRNQPAAWIPARLAIREEAARIGLRRVGVSKQLSPLQIERYGRRARFQPPPPR